MLSKPFTKTASRVMKLTFLLVLAGLLQVSARSHAQLVTYTAKGQSLVKVFGELKKQTGYVFFFDDKDIKDTRPITVTLKGVPFAEALDRILEGEGLTYEIQGNTVVVSRTEKHEKPAETPAEKPRREIQIHVTDSSGAPLAGASVYVRGTRQGGQTDAKGRIALADVPEGAVLIVTYVGYETATVSVHEVLYMNVELKRSGGRLDELQVIAYGTSSKRLTTGNIASVTSEDIEKQPVSNPLLALEGRVPGLFIAQSTGLPGAGIMTQVQGQNSLASGNDPFFVVDGVPYISQLVFNPDGNILGRTGLQTAGYEMYNNFQTNGNPLSFINPDDIESITVLKDAEATAIYGTRAANGAILITTKKAHAGTTKVNFNFENGWARVTRHVPMVNTPQYLEMRHEAMINDGVQMSIADYDVNGDWDTTRYTNWQKQLLGNTAQYTTLYADVSGGNANVQAMFGATYHRETTVFANNFSNSVPSVHFSINANTDNRKFTAQLTGSYMVNTNHLPNIDLTSTAMYLPPDAPALLNPDGSVNWAQNASGTSTLYNNPYAQLLTHYYNTTTNLTSSALLTYNPFPGLSIKSSFGYTNLQSSDIQTIPLASVQPEVRATTSPQANYNNNDINTWLAEPQITYNHKLGIGRIEALAGATFQQQSSNANGFNASGFSSDALLNDISAATTIYPSNQIQTLYRYNALFGRLNYNIRDRYILEGTLNRDGSSRFGSNNQLHNFASAGGAWIFSELKAAKELHWLSFGKLKASYGTTGNDQIGDYNYLSLYSSRYFGLPYQGSSGLAPNGLSNPDLQWEETSKLNFGLDLGLFNNRVLLGADYFRNRSSNQLLSYSLAALTGFGNIEANLPATIQNSGWEFTWTSQNIKGKRFQWTTNANLTIPRNKLVRFNNLATSSYSFNYIIGQPVTVTRSFNLLGVDPQTGFYQILKANGQKTSSDPTWPDDLDQRVDISPKYFGGIDNQFSYRGFSLDFLFQFVNRMGGNFLYENGPIGAMGDQPSWVLNRWRKPGDVAQFQKFSTGNNPFNMGNTFWISSQSRQAYGKAAYIRLKNLAFSWSVPEAWIKRRYVQNASVFLLAQNLLTITNYHGIDPESLNYQTLPPLKTITLGIKATF